MVTIKEIAKASGFSPSTVSIVLSGKADERKISEKTKATIFKVANNLGYRVNVAARRLRTNQSAKTMISVFMAMDKRAYIMTRFLLSLHEAAAESQQPFEIAVHFYENGKLQQFAETIELTNCAIICNASEEDQAYLETAHFSVPIVLYYRHSDVYCAVNVDLPYIGEMVADIFARRGHKHALLLGTNPYFAGMEQCNHRFIKKARFHGLTVQHIQEAHGMQGGYNGGLNACQMEIIPDCVFSMSDSMSIGALRAFGEYGIKVPDQLELISFGTDDPELVKFASVSLSSIHVPVELMAKECIRLLFLQLDGKLDEPLTLEVPVEYKPRESCGV